MVNSSHPGVINTKLPMVDFGMSVASVVDIARVFG